MLLYTPVKAPILRPKPYTPFMEPIKEPILLGSLYFVYYTRNLFELSKLRRLLDLAKPDGGLLTPC